MIKELSLLEKLQAIKEAFLDQNVSIEYKGKKVDFFKDIETALKRLEEIETTTRSVLREDISKKLKALEIIKEKEVDVGWLKRAKDLHEYNSGMGINSYNALTQEEFDLLKEILK